MQDLARTFSIVIQPDPDLGYVGTWIEFPLVMGDGPSIEECVASTKESLLAALSVILENGDPIPSPATDGKRSEQINIRLTGFERIRLEGLARQQGFRSISDFIRTTLLSRAG